MALQNKKSLGQNWLKDRLILDEIAGEANDFVAEKGRLCLEIGPGLGTLTSSLLRQFEQVVAVEYDDRLAANLPASFPGKNLQVVHQDILRFNWAEFEAEYGRPYVVAGNIPYYLTSPLLRILLTQAHPERIVLLVQKEVAERIVAQKKRTYLAIFVANYAFARLGTVVEREYFTPPPQVDSQVVILEPHAPTVDAATLKLAKLCFAAPRKKLLHNLTAQLGLSREAALAVLPDPDVRPGDLSLEDWQELQEYLTKAK